MEIIENKPRFLLEKASKMGTKTSHEDGKNFDIFVKSTEKTEKEIWGYRACSSEILRNFVDLVVEKPRRWEEVNH